MPALRCAVLIHNEVWFQWGFLRARHKHPESTYVLADAVRWQTAPDGSIPAWTRFFRDSRDAGVNSGDPGIVNLLVRDVAQYGLREPCAKCGALLDGAVVEIRAGKIVRGWLSQPGELADAQCLLIAPDGSLTPSGWGDDHAVDLVELPSERVSSDEERRGC